MLGGLLHFIQVHPGTKRGTAGGNHHRPHAPFAAHIVQGLNQLGDARARVSALRFSGRLRINVPVCS